MDELKPFREISGRFDAKIAAIRVYSIQIAQLADQHDKNVIQRHNDAWMSVLGIKPEDWPDEKLQFPEIRVERHGVPESDSGGESPKAVNLERKANGLTITINDPEKARDFVRGFKTIASILREGRPSQGKILRQGALTTLASFFEILVSELIQGYYLRFPQALPADRSLTLAELREFDSKEDAEAHILWKEIDSLLRENVQNQLNLFFTRFKISDEFLMPHMSQLTEMFQRRNLLVHNDGIVNRMYLKNVNEDFIKENDIEVGQVLDVSDQYLAQAISTIYVCGKILFQLCWRKWEKDKSDEADEALIDAVYTSLVENRYRDVILLAEFAASMKMTEQVASRIVLMNRAIALKEMGEKSAMMELLNSQDWSLCSIRFHVALHVLKDEKAKAYELLPKAIMAGEIGSEAMEEWPLFRGIRDEATFKAIYQKHFGEKLQKRGDQPPNASGPSLKSA